MQPLGYSRVKLQADDENMIAAFLWYDTITVTLYCTENNTQYIITEELHCISKKRPNYETV